MVQEAEIGMISIAELLQEKERLKQAERQYKRQGPKQGYKSYLSQYDREELILLAAIASKIEELIALWYQHRRSKDRIKYGKTALTYIYKAMDTYFENMTGAEKEREVYKALRDLKNCHIYLERRA
jgi:alpha-glucuronidase